MSLRVNNVTDNKIILQCEVDGRPNNYTFSPWKHYLNDVLIREVKGYLENEDKYIYYINISTQFYKNRGVYVCSGSYSRNGKMYTHTENTTITSTASSEFYENDLETMTETVKVGFDYNISKIFITGSNSTITWFKDNSSLELSSRIGIRTLEVCIPHDYNQSVFIPYSQTLITITPVQVSDEGWYNCFICYHDDCSNSTFHLLVEDEDRVKDDENDSINNTKRGASPNNKNHGLPVHVFIGAGGAAGLVIIIIVIIVIIVVVTRSRRKAKETVQDDQPHREMEIMENDLYISGDTPTSQQNNVEVLYTPINKQSKGKDSSPKPEMEIMENHLYISADDDASWNQTDGNRVKTKPEMEIMENHLYISADYDASRNQKDGNGKKTKPEMEILENDLYISADNDAVHT
ncbi:hypothetical protein SNE40_017296 [Patella caerulea]|uniref:Ig-like domain-containing protein n=1 Tax=Patella caerulea TaxID=87958 RepID=A0AAN8PPU5_PATCE